MQNSTMIDYLQQLNKKERYFLIGLAWSNRKFKLDKPFLKNLNSKFHINIKGKIFVGVDYHLDWIFAAAHGKWDTYSRSHI